MKSDVLYCSLARILNELVWGGEVLGRENLPEEYPVVFISNHAAALGPIAVTSSLPVRVYPWVIADMVDFAKAPDYLRKDFIEREWRLSMPHSLRVAALLSKLSVRLLRALDCIPVQQGDALRETYQRSIDYLTEGRSLLIFPEDPMQPMNELYKMTPFKKGFARLGEMYFEKTKKVLWFYPLAVHLQERKIKAGKPIAFNPNRDRVQERVRIKHALESTIHNLYLEVELEGHAGIPLRQ